MKLLIGGAAAATGGLGLRYTADHHPEYASTSPQVSRNLLVGGLTAAVAGAALATHRWHAAGQVQSIDDVLVGTGLLGRKTVGAALKSGAIRVQLTGSGPASQRAMTFSIDEQAQKWMRGVSQERLEQALRGALTRVDRFGNGVQLDGINIAFTSKGEAAATLKGLESKFPATLGTDDARQAHKLGQKYFGESKGGGVAGFYFNRQVTLTPQTSMDFMRALAESSPSSGKERAATRAAWILAHEFQHAVTPVGNRPENVAWVEEAVADLIGRSEAIETATAMGVQSHPRHFGPIALTLGYPKYLKILDGLTRLAGASTDTPESTQRLTNFLQTRSHTDVLVELGATIAQRNSLDANAVVTDLLELRGDEMRFQTFLRRFNLRDQL